MASRTETALAAFFAALVEKADGNDRLPAPTRNQALADALDALEDGSGAHLNLVDGSGTATATQLGSPPTYEIEHTAELEWLVKAAGQSTRDAAFDAGLEEIADAVDEINAAIESGGAAYGGVIDHVEIVEVDRSNLAVFGVPQLKGATIGVRLSFTSNRPF